MRRERDNSAGLRQGLENRRSGIWRVPRYLALPGGDEVGKDALTALFDLGGNSGGRAGSHVGRKGPGIALRQDWGGLVGALDEDW